MHVLNERPFSSAHDYAILDQFYEMFIGTVHLNVEEQNELIRQVGFDSLNRVSIGKGMFDFVTAKKLGVTK
jgi:hypothetical protein